MQKLPEPMFSSWASRGFPRPSRAPVPGKSVLNNLKINRITPIPAVPSTLKLFYCFTCLEYPDRRSRSDSRRQQIRHLMCSFSGSCIVSSLLRTHRRKAVKRQHKTQLAPTPHKAQATCSKPLFMSTSLPLLFCKNTSFHVTHVKLLAHSFSSNTAQPFRVSNLIQSTKYPFFPPPTKEHYWDPEYRTNK